MEGFQKFFVTPGMSDAFDVYEGGGSKEFSHHVTIFQKAGNLRQQVLFGERLLYIGIRAQFEAFYFGLDGIFRCEQYYGDV